MDKDRNDKIDPEEFVSGLKDYMSRAEATELFQAIDHDRSGNLTRDEIKVELAQINCALIMDKLRKSTKPIE